jgi:hypothetical protein
VERGGETVSDERRGQGASAGTLAPRNGRRWLLALYVLSVLAVAGQHLFIRLNNNFAIFRASFGNLLAGRDLYVLHPEQAWDLFKYSPTFAVLFAPFSLLPLPASVVLWHALNMLLLFYAVGKLLPGSKGTLALALVYLEALRATQHAQTNGLITALVVLAFIAFERQQQLGAALSIAVGAVVKIFPLAALPMAVFHPRRIRFALFFAGTMLVFLALPLLFVSPHELVAQYQSWRRLEAVDALSTANFGGGGVMELLHLWLGVSIPNWPVQLVGTVLLLLPLAVRYRDLGDRNFRLGFLCSLLVYMVIFNHRSESPSFVIAVTGIAIWYVTSPRAWLHSAVMALTILVVSVSSTDLTPSYIKHEIVLQYRLKTVPCLLAWLIMQAELLKLVSRRSDERAEVDELDVAPAEALTHG